LVRAFALGINDNPFAALGPHDTRAGRIIQCRRSAPYLFRIYCRRRSRGPRTHTLSDCCSATSDLFLFNEGRHFELGKCLGAQSLTVDGVSGVRFAVWAPKNAASVAVVGDFNSWDSADRLACDHGSR
jgi:hypothetical protein